MRNITEQAEKGRKAVTSRNDLMIDELQAIRDLLSDKRGAGLYEALTTAFYFGVNVGMNCKE